MKVLTIIGARPQFIKAAIVTAAFRDTSNIEEVLLHTGQHYDENMSDVFFNELGIPAPKYNLGIGGGSHGQNTGRMIEKIEETLLLEEPDWLLVYGDTDSTLAGALAATKLNISVAHIEAGLRSFNRKMPEEINRVLTDHISDILFAPTQIAVDNLVKEGVDSEKCHLIGDVMNDAAIFYGKKADKQSTILKDHNLISKGFILATCHRAENTDNKNVLSAILESFAKAPLPVVLPIHPRTSKCIDKFGLSLPKNVIVIPPVGYLDMVMLERHARLIATDSGGVQKEAYFHRVPCLTMRTETEWQELVTGGVNKISLPPLEEDFNFAPDESLFDTVYYGTGDASQKIASLLAQKLIP